MAEMSVGLLSAYYSLFGILTAYVFFILQNWLNKISNIESEAHYLINETTYADIRRTRLKIIIASAENSFPLFETSIMIGVMLIIGVLSYLVATNIASFEYIYTISPILIVFLVSVFSIIVSYITGTQRLRLCGQKIS